MVQKDSSEEPRSGGHFADSKAEIRELIGEVEDLQRAALSHAELHQDAVAKIPESMRASAVNLLHYLALRQRDLRSLQDRLSRLGLSSLGRLEAHVDATLVAVLRGLRHLGGEGDDHGEETIPAFLSFEDGSMRLQAQSEAILGPRQSEHPTRIMVTMPGSAAEDPALVRDLVDAGMSLMRINCAHDSPHTWSGMVRRLREAESALGRRCRIAFDLAGPKLRTGPVSPGPKVSRWKPKRDDFGVVLTPALIPFRCGSREEEAPDPEAGIPISPEGFDLLRPGRVLRLRDARNRSRTLHVGRIDNSGRAWAECERTVYLKPGIVIEVAKGSRPLGSVEVLDFRALPGALLLEQGERLILTRGDAPGESAEGGVPARIGCNFAPLFRDCRPGESVRFDDGLIGGTILGVLPDFVEVEIEHVAKHPARLQAEKGINLPDTNFETPALTEKDLEDLTRIATDADMVSLSFVRRPEDVEALIRALERVGADKVGVVLKIETRRAVEMLPAILLVALRHPPVAVMIARGDLGVELGFERMAEIQEEILWICEAAHVPVIWATQVLESLAKRGLATRAEVTDAAMSGRAECVMLNKGPHIVQAVETLANIHARMEDHQTKKFSRMRPLGIAGLASPGTLDLEKR